MCLRTHFMGGENEAQRRGDVRFSFPDPEHFQWKLGIQLLIPCCNHCVTCLCLKVTTTAKSKAAELGGCWRTSILCSSHHIRRFSKSCPSASSTENGCTGPDQRLGLLSILLPTVAINGCPKGENKNRVSTYNTPVSLLLYAYILPPCFHRQSLPAHSAPDGVSACSVAIHWFIFHSSAHFPTSDGNF